MRLESGKMSCREQTHKIGGAVWADERAVVVSIRSHAYLDTTNEMGLGRNRIFPKLSADLDQSITLSHRFRMCADKRMRLAGKVGDA